MDIGLFKHIAESAENSTHYNIYNDLYGINQEDEDDKKAKKKANLKKLAALGLLGAGALTGGKLLHNRAAKKLYSEAFKAGRNSKSSIGPAAIAGTGGYITGASIGMGSLYYNLAKAYKEAVRNGEIVENGIPFF